MTQLTISLNRGQPEMELGVEVGATGHRVVDKKCEGRRGYKVLIEGPQQPTVFF